MGKKRSHAAMSACEGGAVAQPSVASLSEAGGPGAPGAGDPGTVSESAGTASSMDYLMDEESETSEMIQKVMAQVQKQASLPVDEEAEYRFKMGAFGMAYSMLEANRDLEFSGETRDRGRWVKMLALYDEAAQELESAWDAMINADWARIRVVRSSNVEHKRAITHYSAAGAVLGRCESSRGQYAGNEVDQPSTKFAEEVFRKWGRAAEAMGTDQHGQPQTKFDSIEGEYLEYHRQEGSRSLKIKVFAELPGRTTMRLLSDGLRTDAFFIAAKGREQLLAGDFAAAAASYMAAAEAEPTNPTHMAAQVHAKRLCEIRKITEAGTLAFDAGHTEQALKKFKEGTSMDTEPTRARKDLYSRAEEQLAKGQQFRAVAASNLQNALVQAQEIEPLPGDAKRNEMQPLLAIRWGVTGGMWTRIDRYAHDAWQEGRSGECEFRYSVLGRPGMPTESSGTVEQRGFNLKCALLPSVGEEGASRAALTCHGDSDHLVDSEALCLNKHFVSNVDDCGGVIGAESQSKDLHSWSFTRVAEWMAGNTDLQKYAAKVKELKVSGETMEKFRMQGGVGYDGADECVSKLGFTSGTSRKILLEHLCTLPQTQAAYYFGSVTRDANRDKFLTMVYERGIDGSTVTGRGRRPAIHKATGLTRAGKPGDLVWTINQKALRESLSKPRTPTTLAQLVGGVVA